MKKILCKAVILFFIPVAANAQWSGDPAVGTPIVTGTTTAKTGLVSAADGAGGMFVAWIDSRVSSSQSIYLQRILSDGTKKFADEIEVTSSANVAGGTSVTKSNLAIVADGTGGAVLIWQDARNTTGANSNTDIYGQRVDADGNLLWTAGGRRLTVADNVTSNKTSPVIDVVNATEAIFVYRDNRLGTVDLYAQKIALSNGAPQWASEVSVHGDQASTQISEVVLEDGAGGIFVVWEDPRVATTNRNIYGQRIDNSGALLWDAAGVAISDAANNQLTPQIVSDNAGGLVITWSDQRISTNDANIFAQRVNGMGALLWTATGVQVTNAANNQTNPLLVNSGANFVIAWGDNRTTTVGDRNIYAQALNSAGALLWTPSGGAALDGIPVVTATGNQPSNVNSGYQLLEDGSGNTIVVWEDARNGTSNLDIYAQKLDAAGAVQWSLDGVAVSTATNSQQNPVAVQSISGATVVAWRDSRTTANSEIYAARLLSNGVLPVRSIDVSALATTGAINVRWNTIGESGTAFFTVEKSNNGQTFVSIGSVKAKGEGNGLYQLQDPAPLKGTNFYRIRAIDVDGKATLSAVIMVRYEAAAKVTMTIYPNPVNQATILSLNNLAAGTYQLRVMDLSGRVVQHKPIAVNNNYQVVPLQMELLPAGTYVVELAGKDNVRVNKMILKN